MNKLIYVSAMLLLAGIDKPSVAQTTKRVVITGVDTSKKPGDDFFKYANGIWSDTARIPASQAGVGAY